MHFSPALVAGFAAATSAFLIPPNIPDEITDSSFTGAPPAPVHEFIHHVLEQKTTTIDLACPGCPYAIAQNEFSADDITWQHDVDNLIVSNFSDAHLHHLALMNARSTLSSTLTTERSMSTDILFYLSRRHSKHNRPSSRRIRYARTMMKNRSRYPSTSPWRLCPRSPRRIKRASP